MVREINKLTDTARILNKNIRIQIIGRTAQVKGEPTSVILSQRRAERVLAALTMRGLKTSNISTIGLGSRSPLTMGIARQDNNINRSVFFKVIVTNTGKNRTNNP